MQHSSQAVLVSVLSCSSGSQQPDLRIHISAIFSMRVVGTADETADTLTGV